MNDLLFSGEKLLKVGQGFCGTVWADDRDADSVETSVVLKRADGGPGRSISHEYNMHNHILAVLLRSMRNIKGDPTRIVEEVRVNVPVSISFLEPGSREWQPLLSRLPEGFSPCQAIVSERIMPMASKVRQTLKNLYYHGDNKEGILDKANESCLIRPYLGRRTFMPSRETRQRPNKLQLFSLRNFPLHVDQIKDLGLPIVSYAWAMADALAFLHWAAKVDACDVEFVLARVRTSVGIQGTQAAEPCIGTKDFFSELFGQHAMWVLDFDCCKTLEMNEAGMVRAAICFWRNDPFYPRPGADSAEDQELWLAFEERFLYSSSVILQGECDEIRQLPGFLIKTIKETRGVWVKGPQNEFVQGKEL